MEAGWAVHVAGLEVHYGDRRALHAVDLDVPRGQFVGLAGPNGSGKTTLLRTLLGFLEPTAGTVEIFGDPVPSLSIRARARRVAWVPQSEALRDNVPLIDYVLYGRYSLHGPLDADTATDREVARDALREVGLLDRASDGIAGISGGERQRAVLARALAQETPLLLLDEPTAHLDIGHQLDLLARVRRLCEQRGVTVIAALHDLNLAARFADRVVVLTRGLRVADGTPSAVLSEELLARVWGVDAELGVDAKSGLPYLVPRRLVTEAPPSPGDLSEGPVHVVGGGGAGASVMRSLVDAGFRVTAGSLHLLDSDAEAAEALGIIAAVEAPFAPLGDAVRSRNRALLAEARAIVVAPFPVGPSNLANLEDLRPFAGRVPMVLIAPRPGIELDFTGGSALRLRAELRSQGASEAGNPNEAVESVRTSLCRSPNAAAGAG